MTNNNISPTKREYRFRIEGNADDPAGNPLPKLKMTGKQHWLPRARAYARYKSKVVSDFLTAIKGQPEEAEINRSLFEFGKPLGTAEGLASEMHIEIRWANGVHGDPENIFGAIADSLFHQDKYLDGSFRARRSADKRGSVEVRILLEKELK